MNNLGDLNAFLFEQMERLNDEELNGEDLKKEIERSKAVTNVAGKIIDNGNLALDARKFYDGRMNADEELPKMLKE